MKNDHSFFQNRECEYFPCHKSTGENFNCLFCFCPLYTLRDKCGGNFTYTEKGIKDCSRCLLPHSPGSYDYILSKFNALAELAKESRSKKEE